MSVTVTTLVREFAYNGVALPDPGPALTVEQVRDVYSATYPEIVTASIEGPEIKGGKQVYTFRRAVGTKGGNTLRTCVQKQDGLPYLAVLPSCSQMRKPRLQPLVAWLQRLATAAIPDKGNRQ